MSPFCRLVWLALAALLPTAAAHAAHPTQNTPAPIVQRVTSGETDGLTDLRGFGFLPGDTVCILGSALAERMQHHGWLESRLQCRLPTYGLSFRNLGFASDELTVRQRTAGFGSQDEWLERCDPSVILAFFGSMESFRGPERLPTFRADLADFIRRVRTPRGDDQRPPRLILCSPIAVEDTGDPNLPSATEAAARLLPYVTAMAEVAAEHDVSFLDLFTPMQRVFHDAEVQAASIARWGGTPQGPQERALGDATTEHLTINGTHLTAFGNSVLAEIIEGALVVLPVVRPAEGYVETPGVVPWLDRRRIGAVREAVLEKNLLWFNRYRATDGYNVYGGRSSLEYVDGVTNYEVLQRELEVLDALTAEQDRRIVDLAQGGDGDVSAGEIPPLIAVTTNRPGSGPDGAHTYRTGDEAIEAMTLHDGFAANLYADEQMFPSIANPVQMAWDTSDRLWVAAWPTYPHWQPGQPMNDALVVLEDTDGDGRADKATPFADDLHNPTGFEFFNGGVLVANPPDLLFLKDTDGDGRADVRMRVLHGLSSADTHHSANSFVFGPDGAFYFQEGTFHQSQVETPWGPVHNTNAAVWRFEPRTWRVERYIPYGFANPHGHVFDRWGQDFVTDGTGNQNYWALPMTGWLPEPLKKPGIGTFFPQRSRPAGATEILSSSHFPDELQGNYLIANVIGFQGLFQYAFHDDGAGFGATEVQPIMHSSDPNFRPVDIEVGPDGALYVLDWQAPLIGHMQHHLRDPSRDHSHGRIYRFTYPSRPLSVPPAIAGQPVDELVELLKHPEDRVRSRVRIELSGRDTAEVVAAAQAFLKAREKLGTRFNDSDVAPTQREPSPVVDHEILEAVWLLQQHQVVNVPMLKRLLDSNVKEAAAAAVRVVRQMRRQLPDLFGILKARVGRGSGRGEPRIDIEALVALSFLPSRKAAELAQEIQLRLHGDRFLEYAFLETMRALEPYWRGPLTNGEEVRFGRVGMEWALAQLDTDELMGVQPSSLVYLELLSRHGLEPDAYANALRELATVFENTVAEQFVVAVEHADARDTGHVDHLLSGLFSALPLLAVDERAPLTDALAVLSADARRTSTRRLALAALMEQRDDLEATWSAATRSFRGMTDFLEALPFVKNDAKKGALLDRIVSLIDTIPTIMADVSTGGALPRGRYVRIELPGDARTLTLAEVEVWSGGTHIGMSGTASQSSVNWGGVPQNALDGNTSGKWSDGAQTHTIEDQPDPWWEVDLGSEQPLDAVVVWNRTDGSLGTRLEGYRLTVFDEARRPVYEAHDQPAPLPSMRHQLAPLDVALRRAAVRCLSALAVGSEDPARRAAIVRTLRLHFDNPLLHGEVVDGLLSIPLSAWDGSDRLGLAVNLIAAFKREDQARHQIERDEALIESAPAHAVDKRLLALTDAVMPYLERGIAVQLLSLRRRLGPTVVVIHPVPDALLFDRTSFSVVAGRTVELRFENTDIMPHNLVVILPGALATVGLAAEDMAAEPDAWDRAYIPDLDEVLWGTRLLQPGESQTLVFSAPADPGDYPFVCTFPGHWVRMNGVMRVVDATAEDAALDAEFAKLADASAPLDASGSRGSAHPMARVGSQHGTTPAIPPALHPSVKPASERSYVAFWSTDDFADSLAKPSTGSDTDSAAADNIERGRSVFAVASCRLCHAVGGEGGSTGPPLEEAVARHDRAALLAQILAPSDTLLEGYASETFVTIGGGVVSGRVLSEDDTVVRIVVDPYKGTVRELQLTEIARRRPSSISTMPEGLLSTFEREEIFALLDYLESLRQP